MHVCGLTRVGRGWWDTGKKPGGPESCNHPGADLLPVLEKDTICASRHMCRQGVGGSDGVNYNFAPVQPWV
ncbi:hypothetical protein XELAEV_18014182mg [Xenopus laevis]|uniref:Uncharacterized protein n=1 Tax=Xenopus laevis TaxID=8355 RepID=A0A974HUR6_XENLA|nr:hypothetical protein XELAEV_18014182mg [Xenopus laevis]